jgi:glycosyltransferase involved in cell wall biosynthesis
MRVALVHYHLRRGGVSSVIRHQARSLRDAGVDVLLITGEAAPEDVDIPYAQVENLGYDKPEDRNGVDGDRREKAAEQLAAAVTAAMERRWGEAADIVHVHNPLIQKNALLIPALKILNSRGIRLLLQNHDLAEDFRPDVYAEHMEYPDNCHYAVINSRDYSYLHRSGLKIEGLHLIPNEVSSLTATPGLNRTRYLYPVRAIRRKNIGEALLLSLYIPRGRTIAITLPPAEKDSLKYRRWVDFAGELGLPVEFALGTAHSLEDLFGSAICALSTSVKEGFGFSFLEPWTAGRGIMGRRIDYVCRDFEEAGVSFDSLYSSIEIPSEYVSPGLLRKKMETTMRKVYNAFGLEAPPHTIHLMTEDLFSRDTLDFGRLDEEFQASIIHTLQCNGTAYRDIAALNPFLGALGDWKSDEGLIGSNREIVLTNY